MEDLKISRILHAGYVFKCGMTQIAFDPLFENPFSHNCHAFPNVHFDHEKIKKLRFDAIFISHYHDDHCSFDSLNLLDRKTPLFIYCVFEELFSLVRDLGFQNVYPLEIGLPVSIGPITVIPKRALDADVDSIFHIQVAGLNILNVVDSWIDSSTLDQLSKTAPWDLILWPFQTMREIEVLSPARALKASRELPPEWLAQLKVLNPKYIVPSSCQFRQEVWSWYNQAFFPISYRQFQIEVESVLPKSKVIRMNPSVSFEMNQSSLRSSQALEWIHPIGEQNLDYDYDPDVRPPATAEIAKHFPKLDAGRVKAVFDYCSEGLLEKYRSMSPPENNYFQKPKVWCLRIYDFKGEATDFYYRISGSSIEPLSRQEDFAEWLTEIPLWKLSSALENGEALTSLYIRINDMTFDSKTEAEIAHADIVEDPLIRCLYNGEFAAYQKAQLKKIKN